jgi:hypothetical protein
MCGMRQNLRGLVEAHSLIDEMVQGAEGSREGTENVHFALRTREHCHRLKGGEGSV